MLRKLTKILLVAITILGVIFAISNLATKQLDAGTEWEQLWEWEDGTFDCMGAGQSCITVYPEPN